MRLVGVFQGLAAEDPAGRVRAAAFTKKGLQELGWIAGGNVRFDNRWGEGQRRRHAPDKCQN